MHLGRSLSPWCSCFQVFDNKEQFSEWFDNMLEEEEDWGEDNGGGPSEVCDLHLILLHQGRCCLDCALLLRGSSCWCLLLLTCANSTCSSSAAQSKANSLDVETLHDSLCACLAAATV